MIQLAGGAANDYAGMDDAMNALRIVLRTEEAPGVRLYHTIPHWGCVIWGCKTEGLVAPGWHQIPGPAHEKLSAFPPSARRTWAISMRMTEDALKEVNGKIGWTKIQLAGYDGRLHEDEAWFHALHTEMPLEPGDPAWLLRAHEGISDALAASRQLARTIENALGEIQAILSKHAAGEKKP